MYNDYLMHYGVKGMKWGVRHDPQPSGFRRRRAANQQYRQSVKAAGKRNMQAFRENYGSREARRAANQQFRNEVNAAKQKNKEAFALSDKQKKILKGAAIGAVVAGAGVLSVAVLKSGAGKAAISKGAKYLRMGKTDATIMKIAAKDAIGNSKRSVVNLQNKISVNRNLSKIHKNVKKLEKQRTKELQKNILKNKTAAQKRQFYKDVKRIGEEQKRLDEEARAIRKRIRGY